MDFEPTQVPLLIEVYFSLYLGRKISILLTESDRCRDDVFSLLAVSRRSTYCSDVAFSRTFLRPSCVIDGNLH